jgi:hypothetical protein
MESNQIQIILRMDQCIRNFFRDAYWHIKLQSGPRIHQSNAESQHKTKTVDFGLPQAMAPWEKDRTSFRKDSL